MNESFVSAVVLQQAAEGLRDEPLKAAVSVIGARNKQQLDWLLARLKQAAPQTLIVPQ